MTAEQWLALGIFLFGLMVVFAIGRNRDGLLRVGSRAPWRDRALYIVVGILILGSSLYILLGGDVIGGE